MIVTLVDLLLLKMYTAAYKKLQVLSLCWSSSRLHYKHTAAKKKQKRHQRKRASKDLTNAIQWRYLDIL